jgi:acyl carrier protein
MKTIDVEKQVRQIIAEQTGLDWTGIKLTDQLANDLEMDSIDEVEIVIILEEAFNFEIDDEEVVGIVTVQQLVKFVEDKLAKK